MRTKQTEIGGQHPHEVLIVNHPSRLFCILLRTGKTTVARLIGRYLYAHGVLPRDTFVERNALALKGRRAAPLNGSPSCGLSQTRSV